MESNTHYHLYFMVKGADWTPSNIATLYEIRVTEPFSSHEAAREAAPEERRYITEELNIQVDSMSIRHCYEDCERERA